MSETKRKLPTSYINYIFFSWTRINEITKLLTMNAGWIHGLNSYLPFIVLLNKVGMIQQGMTTLHKIPSNMDKINSL